MKKHITHNYSYSANTAKKPFYRIPPWKTCRYASSFVFLLTLLVILPACGGGDDKTNTDGDSSNIAQGKFANNPVSGLNFKTASLSGKTAEDGSFQFVPGETVVFFMGESTNFIELGSTKGAAIITPAELNPPAGATAHEDFSANITSFLMTMDDDQNPDNGIRIKPELDRRLSAELAAGAQIDFNVAYTDFSNDANVEKLLIATQRQLTNQAQATAQLSKNYPQSRSSTIALTSDNRRIVVVNRQNDSISVIQVRDEQGGDTGNVVAEIPVGKEPRYVAITPNDTYAYVTNAVDGTVSVVDLNRLELAYTIPVGTEPRGIAISPNGKYVLVANHTAASVSILDTQSYTVLKTIKTGGNPQSIAITNDGDGNDKDERVMVTRFFGELIDKQRPDGFNDAKQGIVDSFLISDALLNKPKISQIVLSPQATGFNADRRQFCLKTRQQLQNATEVTFFNSGVNSDGDGASQLANDTFCPDTNSEDASEDGQIGKDPQLAYANQLYAALIRGAKIYIANVAASPEPPVKFNSNIQAMMGIVNRFNGEEQSVNLNELIAKETQPDEGEISLDRLFGNDIVAMEADKSGKNFLIVSRGGNYVLRAQIDESGQLVIDGGNGVVRFQTGNLPSGIVMSSDGTRAYTNNEVSTSVTAMDLDNNTVLERDMASSEPPAPGTQKHRNVLGKLAFFTALGIPDVLDTNGDGAFDIAIRDIVPLEFRGKASDNGWSSCASCHEDGHSDNVTWIFPTGPRQTIPLEGTFAKNDPSDQRILNWNGVRGSVTDFNNNSRGVQGGIGFATNVNGVDRTNEVFNHGPTQGISDALDAMTEWVANAVRSPIMPEAENDQYAQQGAHIFNQTCSSCHGGAKWTKSRTSPTYANNPTFSNDPLGANFFAQAKQPPLDPALTVAGPQIVSVSNDSGDVLSFIDNVGTLDAENVVEIRGAGALGGGFIDIAGDPNEGLEVAKQSTQGFSSLGGIGFNAPSLLGVGYHAPYLHDGSAQSLNDVYQVHTLPDGNSETPDPSIDSVLTPIELEYLTMFLQSIDDDTPTFTSDTDRFLEQGQP